MNNYVLILYEDPGLISNIFKEEKEKNSNPFHDFANCTLKPDVCKILTLNQSKTLFQVICLTVKSLNKNEDISWHQKTEDSDITSLVKNISKTHIADYVFTLADNLPPPGCFLLDVFWYISTVPENCAKSNSNLLGALKKLKSWHLADVKLIAADDLLLNNKQLSLASRFISGTSEKIYSLLQHEPLGNSTRIWKGSIEVWSPDMVDVSFLPGFEITKHNCVTPILCMERSLNNIDEEVKDFVWIGHILKALEIVDTTTIPLMLFGDTVFQMTCDQQNKSGHTLHKTLSEHSNAGLLCRLTYILNDEEFSPCSELGTKEWKKAVLKTPKSMSLPPFKLNQPAKYMHMIVTPQTETNCNLYTNDGNLNFHCHVLNVLDDEEVGFVLQQEYNSCSNSTENTHFPVSTCRVNTDAIFAHDQLFGEFFSYVIQKYMEINSEEITPSIMQLLIIECFKKFEEHFAENLYNVNDKENIKIPKKSEQNVDPLPELAALRNREKKFKNLEKQKNLSAEKPWSTSNHSKIKLSSTIGIGSEDIMKCFDKIGSKKVFSSLSSIQNKCLNNNAPSIDKLQDFPSAIASSYHGLTFNVDARGSEKDDRHCRRLMEKLVKYETYSVGSKSQVPSPATMNICDSPEKNPFHTPGKKKKLQKMAEKMYNRRATQSLSQVPTTSMILRSTPKKNKSKAPDAKSLLLSPSVHNMSLRSSTPTKQPKEISAKKRICYSTSTLPASQKTVAPKAPKQPERKLLQKTYVKDNKKRLQELVVSTLGEHNIDKKHPKFNQCAKRLYNVSMAFLKDLKSSRGLENTMIRTVQENVKLVLSFEIET